MRFPEQSPSRSFGVFELMKNIGIVLMIIALLALTACGADNVEPTVRPTPAPTLTPDPIFGPTPSPTRPAPVAMDELVLDDTLRIAPPYPVSHLYDDMAFGVEDAEYRMDVYYCTDESFPRQFSYIFAVVNSEGSDFESPERVQAAYEALCVQFMGEVADALREERVYAGPEGDINGLVIRTMVSSVPVEIRVIPYGGKLFMAFGMAVNGEITEAAKVLDGLTFVDALA